MPGFKILGIILAALLLGGIGVAWYIIEYAELDMYVPLFVENCGQCHGSELAGTKKGVALVGRDLTNGDTVSALQESIRNAHGEFGRRTFAGVLTEPQIKGLAIYIGERRLGQRFVDFQFDKARNIPTAVQTSEAHNFTIETVIDDLDPLIFSIEPLPDGSLLVTEKERGLSIVSAKGVQSDLIEGTPETGGSIDIRGVQYGMGWLLDVAIHPDYEQNGWIYLHYTDVCGERCESSLFPSTMNRVDRGRIREGKWVDVETIWQAPLEFYVATPDTGAGGRIAFDDSGNVYFSVGIKSSDAFQDITPQDLSSPYGKIHRVKDDGTIPLDNPFAATSSDNREESRFIRRSIWTYGHRSQQGLEWHPLRKRVWDSEMGPRGGDEINELLPGKNYGWPFYSKGLEYAGGYVERHKLNAIEFDGTQIEHTLVDITPSPAISSFVIYAGDPFPRWQNNVLIGSLKGGSLFRMVFEGKTLVHQETVIKDLSRIRDIEVGFDGLLYLLLENKAGSAIVRLVPHDK